MADRKIGEGRAGRVDATARSPRQTVVGDANLRTALGESPDLAVRGVSLKHRVGPLGGRFVIVSAVFAAIGRFIAVGERAPPGANAAFLAISAFVSIGTKAVGSSAAAWAGVARFIAVAGAAVRAANATFVGVSRFLVDSLKSASGSGDFHGVASFTAFGDVATAQVRVTVAGDRRVTTAADVRVPIQ